MSSPASAAAASSATTITPAMEWFSPFYQTPAMIKAGCKVTGHGADGEPLDYEKERLTFEEERKEQLGEVKTQLARKKAQGIVGVTEALLQEGWDEAEKERPWSMLTSAAWSFLHNAVSIYDPQSKLKSFSDGSKLRILMDGSDIQEGRAVSGGLTATGKTDIGTDEILAGMEEDENGDESIESQPIMHMGYGLLTIHNARFWSLVDLKRAAEACGTKVTSYTNRIAARDEATEAILEVQVELLEEIVGKNWHREAGGRGYNPIVALLADSKKFMAFVTEFNAKEVMKATEAAAILKHTGDKRKAGTAEKEHEGKRQKRAHAE